MRILGLIFLFMVSCFVTVVPDRAEAQTTTQTQDQAGQLRTHWFKQDDYHRRYLLYRPANMKRHQGPRPLVLVIHGGGSSDRSMIKLDKGRWNALADAHGFYVAYPNAVDRLWDFGEGKTSSELDKRVDDLTYFDRVLDDISERVTIDPSRVFATGISRGGQASYYLACQRPDRIRAVMPVAMGLPVFMVDDCTQGPPVGIAIMNGTADPQVPYEGGQIKVFRQKRDFVLSADDTVALWRRRNGCLGGIDTHLIDVPGDKTSITVSENLMCTAPVKIYRVNNGGHTWPSGVAYLPSRIVGEVSRDINAADEGWAFFSRF